MAGNAELPPHADDKGQVDEHGHHAHKRHQGKVRAAWISFVGRIIAQVAGAAATIVIGLAVITNYGSSRATPRQPEAPLPAPAVNGTDEIDLVVLPFDDLSSDRAGDYLADALTESVISNLARIETLHVISRTSSMHYKGARKSVAQIAQELGVDFVVEGTVTSGAGRVLVMVQLIDALTDRQLWSRRYEQPLTDLVTLQATVSAAVAREIRSTVPVQTTRPAGRLKIVPAAYEHYVKGRGASRSRTAAGLRAAVRQFQDAIRLDASFAPAHAALATAHVLLGSWPSSAPDGLPDLERARAAAKRAIELDPDLPEAHAVLAAVAQRLDWDWTAADAGYRRAIRMSPGESLAREWYAGFLAEQGRHREALAEAEFTVELDPLLADAHALLGFVHYHARRFDRAAAAARRALELRTAHVPARLILAWSLLESGNPAGAIAACEAQSWRDGLDEMLATLADAHLRRGANARADEVQRELLALEAPSPSALVRLHISRGELDAAFVLLGRALDRKWTMARTLRVDPLFARLRRDPRYAGLIDRLAPGGRQ